MTAEQIKTIELGLIEQRRLIQLAQSAEYVRRAFEAAPEYLVCPTSSRFQACPVKLDDKAIGEITSTLTRLAERRLADQINYRLPSVNAS